VLRDRVTGRLQEGGYGGRLREGKGGREKERGREGDRKWVYSYGREHEGTGGLRGSVGCVLWDRVTGRLQEGGYGGRLREGKEGREKERGREGEKKWVYSYGREHEGYGERE
jgi:hypothetical protein